MAVHTVNGAVDCTCSTYYAPECKRASVSPAIDGAVNKAGLAMQLHT